LKFTNVYFDFISCTKESVKGQGTMISYEGQSVLLSAFGIS